MKIIKCDTCKTESAKSYKYKRGDSTVFVDLCISCVQDFAINNQIKLTEVRDKNNADPSVKKIIHG